MNPNRKIMYCAIPTRMRSFGEKAKEIARKTGYSPVVPFDALSYEDSEGGPLSRGRTLRFDIDLMRCCDTLDVFGIAPGVMGEIRDALDRKMDIRVFYGHDPKWEKEYQTLSSSAKHGDLLAELRGPHRLIALVGQSAIGKNYWSEKLIEIFDGIIRGVKNTTTRQRRLGKEKEDNLTYNFVSREEFEKGIVEQRFIEHDEYLGNYYGSSMDSIRAVLKNGNGIFAITPSGAKALYERRFEINLDILLLKPINTSVIKRNLEIRGVSNSIEQDRLIEAGKQFYLPPDIKHHTVEITGDIYEDKNSILSVVRLLITP